MATEKINPCTGSTLLQPISDLINLPIDQVNFVVCQLFALLTAVWFRLYLHPSKTSTFVRHFVATLLGFYFALFCFGWYALHFVFQSGITYTIMILAGAEHMHKYCFVVALGYLSLCQVTRVYIFDYGMYSADFTGPMMIITQKITSLAFEIHDGLARKDEQLTPSQRRLAVRRMPSLLEYFSYNCNFMGILVGPTSSYKDYIAFIEGTAYHSKYSETNGKENGKYKQSEPSPKMEVIHKLAVCAISLLVYLTVSKSFSVERNVDDAFIASTPFYTRVIYLYLSMLTTRPKYYFAWTLADAINNAAGFGFNGYNKDGTPRWDLVSNIRIANIEFATSFKTFLDNWNIQTALLMCINEHSKCFYKHTVSCFFLLLFQIRHNVRQYFLGSSTHKLIYDVITGAGTQVAISYTVVPFVLLSVPPSLKFYKSCYFCLHIICFLVITMLSLKPRQIRDKPTENSLHQEHLQGGLVGNNSHSATDNNSNQKRKAT
ncbi:membrane-bound O-acyltransferase domain-containing protein 2 [Huso huso]|uniref:Membrane-bound O-acyltransferase domain-containing protein 2 n=1 Tax=Huso huso TaxID=61971 RepID=A0ABR0ZVB4_HUSHU